jgi:penicillin-binding protein 1A
LWETSLIKKIILGITLVIVSISIYFSISFYRDVAQNITEILEHKMEISSEVFDRNGERIANFVGKEHRLYVKFENIPPKVIEALLAIEDTSFFEHRGINIDAIFRAAIKDVVALKMVEGASTITQQFVRNAVLTKKKNLFRKIQEVILAVEIEKYMSKEQILEKYLNLIYFGRGYYGIRTASKGYFHKELDALTTKEIAILIGLIKAPSFYDPTRNYGYSIGRANRVISRMYEGLGWITKIEYDDALAENPTVFRTTKTQNVAPYVVDEVRRRLKDDFTDLHTGGYLIKTTIDLQLHDMLRTALKNGHKKITEKMEKRGFDQGRISKLNGASILVQQSTGDILSMVGGIDYKKSVFNRVTQGQRQVGSSIKPFIYQVALNMGLSGATKLYDISRTYNYTDKDGNEKIWSPQNYTKKEKGLITLRNSLIKSKNLATINMVDRMLGGANVHRELVKFGLNDLPMDLSVALGSYTTSMYNLAHHYTMLSNGGIKTALKLISEVSNKEGFIVYEEETKSDEFVSPEQNYLIVDIMRDAVRRRDGTGRRARVEGLQIAGKTGTTNDGKDVWFNSFTPTYQLHVWFGNDDNTPIIKKAGGGSMSAPVAGEFYSELIKMKPYIKRQFDKPDGVKTFKFGNVYENFTPISKPPKQEIEFKENDSLIF